MRYLPFLSGIYTTAPGLTPHAKATMEEDKNIFQIDNNYLHYLDNKQACRKENIRKYYSEHSLDKHTVMRINQYVVERLVTEHPGKFLLEHAQDSFRLHNVLTRQSLHWKSDWLETESDPYLSLFDALCSQVQEDLAVFQLDESGQHDFLTAIHLCSPNHWSPGEKIGKPFDQIHEPVPNMERVTQHYQKMLTSIVSTRGPYTRFAWGISTDTRLNHHPGPPPGMDPLTWHGRSAGEGDTKFYIRTERQNLVGFPEVHAFLFTIRTYFYEVDSLNPDETKALMTAVRSMDEKTLRYKGLTNTKDLLFRNINPPDIFM